MAVSFIFPDKSVLTLDAAPSQSHDRESTISVHQVEEGADVADHVSAQAKTLTIGGVVAYHPIVKDGSEPEANRHIKAFERLEKAHDESELLTVTTGLMVYKNMAIKSVSYPRSPSTGFDLVFTIALQELRFASAQAAKVPKDAIGKAPPGVTGAAAKKAKAKTRKQSAAKSLKGLKAKVGM